MMVQHLLLVIKMIRRIIKRWEMWVEQRMPSYECQLCCPMKPCKWKMCACEASPPTSSHEVNLSHVSLVLLGKDSDNEHLGSIMLTSIRNQMLDILPLCSEEKICTVSINAFLHTWLFAMNLFLFFFKKNLSLLTLEDLNHLQWKRRKPSKLASVKCLCLQCQKCYSVSCEVELAWSLWL